MANTRSSRQTTGTRGRSRAAGSGTIDQLTSSVNELIQENKYLKQQLRRFQGSEGWGTAAPRQLVTLQRKVMGAVGGITPTRAPRARTTAAVSTPAPARGRKITDPVILQKKRAALAKARAARSAKRAAQR